MPNNFTVIILAGGLATRLYPETLKIPKSLIKIYNDPFIKHQLLLLKSKGITNIILSLGNLGEKVEKYIQENNNFDLDIEYSFDGSKLLGTGGAIKNAFSKLSNPFGIIYGDSFLNIEYLDIINYFKQYSTLGLMTVLKNNNLWDKSNIVFRDGKILEYNKDKTGDYQYIDYGFSILKKESFENFFAKDIFDLKEVFYELVRNNQLIGYEVFNRFYEIGSVSGIKETENYIKNLLK